MLCTLLGVAYANAQSDRTVVLLKAAVAPVIDGVGDDDVWTDATVNNIDLPFKSETPTLGQAGETNWKAAWNNDGIYILVTVTDDLFFPKYLATGDDYQKDKVELYFDCNPVLADGLGGSGGPGNGHHQIAPDIAEADITGTPITGTGTQNKDVVHAVVVDGTNYVMEYFIPWSILNDKDGAAFIKTAPMGFDVTVVDNDLSVAARQRACWSNDGTGAAADESWNNMNDCGTITLDNVGTIVDVEDINITNTATTITTEAGTLQMTAEILLLMQQLIKLPGA